MFYLTAFFMVLPYLLPVSKGELLPGQKPYGNSHFTTIDGIQLHYRIETPDTVKGNILFIHGFAGSTYSWNYAFDTLVKEGYRVLAVDQPAFGYSDKRKNTDYSLTKKCQIFWKLCDSISGDKWIINGHSMGASVAGAMSSFRPDRVSAVVLTDGFFYPSTEKRGFADGVMGNWLTSPWMMRMADAGGNLMFFDTTSFQNLLSSAYSRPATPQEAGAYLAPFLMKRSGAAIFEFSAAAQNISAEEQNTLPTLVIWGEKDTWIPFTQAQRFISERKNCEVHTISAAGHCPMETHPQEYYRLLLTYLHSLPK